MAFKADMNIVNTFEIDRVDPFAGDETLTGILKALSRAIHVPVAAIAIHDNDTTKVVSVHSSEISQDIVEDPGLLAAIAMTKSPTSTSMSLMNGVVGSNPLSLSNNGLKFYSGRPISLKSNNNHVRYDDQAGVICVADVKPRQLDDWQLRLISDLATVIASEIKTRASVVKLLELDASLLQRALEEKESAEFIANHDSLTGLANRLHFMKMLDEELEKPHVDSVPAVYMLDLDKFKPANDTYGHQAGDAVLKEVARRIRLCIGRNDLAARLGGDEFVILKRDADLKCAEVVAQDLVALLSEPYEIDGITIHLSSSVGFTMLMSARDDSRQLIRNADLALYCAKSKGGCNYQQYNSSIDRSTKTRNR